MKRLAIILATSSLTLASCATVPNEPVATIDRVQARYDAAKAWADLMLPYVSPDRVALIRLGMALSERGLQAGRTAATIVEMRAALAQANTAMSSIDGATKRDRASFP